MDNKFKQEFIATHGEEGTIDLLFAVLDSVPVSLFIKDADLRSIFVNQENLRMNGMPFEDCIGLTDFEFHPHEDAVGFAARDQEVLQTGEIGEQEESHNSATGEIIHQLTRKARVVTPDGKKFLIGTNHEINELKIREGRLAEGKRKAEDLGNAKTDFLANMSHEIRTPMNGVLGMAEVLSSTPLSEEQQMYLDVIRRSGQSLLTIINDILDFSKLEAGQMELASNPFDIREDIADVIALLQSKIDEKELSVATDISPDAAASYLGDAGRIRQITTNLLGNAIKFTDHGGLTIRIDNQPKTLSAGLRIEIIDTGCGISLIDQQRLFKKFSQVDSTANRAREGTGLGLAISASLVAAMNGRIGVESRPGDGSTFWFELPLDVDKSKPT